MSAQAAELWSIQQGVTQISFEEDRLEALGIQLLRPEGRHSENSPTVTAVIRPDSSLVIASSGGVFDGFSEGAFEHVESFSLTAPGHSVSFDAFRIHPFASEFGIGLFIQSGRGDTKTAYLELANPKIGFDGNSIRIESGVTATAELARAMGNPKAEGVPLGYVKVSAEIVWAGGDAPVNPGDASGGVAGGNNGTDCWNTGEPDIGPDVIVGDLIDISNYSSSGGIEAFAVGTTSCNIGSQNLLWQANNPNHPVIGQNMFRLKDGRFEQIGQSWLKHGFTALTQNVCGCGCSGQGGSVLGVGCSDPYCCGLNGDQANLGPKYQVNPFTGAFTYPPANPAWSGSVDRRLQVAISDLDPAQNGGGLYFVEGQYVTPDDAAAGNRDNNASYRPITISGSGSAWSAALAGTTQRERPAIRAWKDNDPSVTESNLKVPGEGTLILSAKATNLGTGFWHYEYALQNLNSDRSVGSFSVPLDSGATVQNIGFRDVPYHSGEPFDGTDWPGVHSGGAVSWATTQTYAQNPNANALRWGTLYNFRFDANRAPTTGSATLGLFKPGTPTSITGSTVVPTSGPADCQPNGITDNCDISCAGACSGVSGCGLSADCNSNGVPDECETNDCNSNGIPDSCDIAAGRSNDCNTNGVPDECDSFPTTPLTSIRVATGLSQPLFVGAPRGDARLWIVERTGQIKILSGGAVLATPYLNVSSIITATGGEQGLLGLAFDPNFNSNGRFYINYTNTAGNTVIARYNATGGNPASNTADPASAVILKTITQDFTNHNGGCLQFGPDGFLYAGMGDGGSGNDPNARAQDTGSLLGKMLRLDVNNPPTYVPASNPFVGPGNPLDEIWAIGMRNPWRFSFDRTRGDMYIGDVGQDAREEVDFEPAGIPGGRNYGWRCMEGTLCTGLSGCTCNAPALTLPIHEEINAGSTCSITGGYVYRGCAIPDLQGTYFYADYCANFIKSFRYTQSGGVTNLTNRTTELTPNQGAIAGIVSFGEDGDGELYYVSISNGGVYKIVPNTGPGCGNGIVETGEECEPPNTATCDANCQSIPCVPPVLSDAFETNLGWTVSNSVGLTSGAWVRGDPNGTAAQPEDDHSTSGTQCYFTGQGAVGGGLGDADVDGGSTTLISPTINLSGGGTIGYWRWYSNNAGASPNQDTFRVDISNNNGTSWVNAETVGPAGAGTSGGWIYNEFSVADFVTPTNQIRVRFVAEDVNPGSIVEAAVDDFVATPTDCNNNCVADVTDISMGTSTDCNANGVPDDCESAGSLKSYNIPVNPPLSIPDGTGQFVSTTFNVPDSGIITDLNLGLVLPHTWNGDLTVRLQKGSTLVTVIDRPGFPVPQSQWGFDNDGFNVILDDEGTGGNIENIDVAAGVASPPSYVPNNPLSAFDGMEKQGLWTISASDAVGSDTGSITNWSLIITNQGNNPCGPITDCNENGQDDADDIAKGTSQDCNNNDIPDECDIADGTSEDCEGGPVGVVSAGGVIINTFCFGCHNTMGQGGQGFPGPNIRNKSRVTIWNKLLPPTNHPGGAFGEFTQQNFADLEAFLSDFGSRGRPDRIPDECQSGFSNCDGAGLTDACELEAGTQSDLDHNGIPDDCESCESNAECDDGLFCNGSETCDLGSGLCQSGTPPCTPVQICVESTDSCLVVPVLSCELNSTSAAIGGSVQLDLKLSGPITTLRGYEVRIAIQRTSGMGSLAPNCPDGMQVNEARADFIFQGNQVFVGNGCDDLRMAAAVFVGIPIPQGEYYLADWTLNVSPDATPGTTFEISIMAKPDSFLRDANDNPITFMIDAACVVEVTDCPAPLVEAVGPRYFKVTPLFAPNPVAIQVTGNPAEPNVGCVARYVQANGTLGVNPVYQLPSVWGTVAVHDDEIIPSASYRVRADCGPTPGTTMSPQVAVSTWAWGDVNHSGEVNIDDILCVLNGFSGVFTFCTLEGVDLFSCVPDGVVNLDDMLRVLAAFGQQPYPCPGPCP